MDKYGWTQSKSREFPHGQLQIANVMYNHSLVFATSTDDSSRATLMSHDLSTTLPATFNLIGLLNVNSHSTNSNHSLHLTQCLLYLIITTNFDWKQTHPPMHLVLSYHNIRITNGDPSLSSPRHSLKLNEI